MRIREQLYFAPSIRFAELDVGGLGLPKQFQERIRGYYLDPALKLAGERQGFPAGLLAVCAIDAIAKVSTGATGVTGRIVAFCRKIPGLEEPGTAALFCEHFRNGLVHEAMVKGGSEFSLDVAKVVDCHRKRFTVNPSLLAIEVGRILQEQVDFWRSDMGAGKAFAKSIKRTFQYELDH